MEDYKTDGCLSTFNADKSAGRCQVKSPHSPKMDFERVTRTVRIVSLPRIKICFFIAAAKHSRIKWF